ncbi:Hypothetical predicted protein [Xyrichtys novacula]|uniref:Uncharacterized protein n=1 Tax=Xyrichtys novacula TaxID=13765 RepID=A0AAV1F103_XYRNO|nr:Hypothetical predicted protein [Xyrichtys novacula]
MDVKDDLQANAEAEKLHMVSVFKQTFSKLVPSYQRQDISQRTSSYRVSGEASYAMRAIRARAGGKEVNHSRKGRGRQKEKPKGGEEEQNEEETWRGGRRANAVFHHCQKRAPSLGMLGRREKEGGDAGGSSSSVNSAHLSVIFLQIMFL